MADTFAEFTETVTLELPSIEDKILDFVKESSGSHGLIVEVAAIHAGMTSNFNYYASQELEKALGSWVNPYPKPIIMNHDLYTDPVGRVMAAKMDTEADGIPFTRLQIAVTDPGAMEKIADSRYLTGSVGGKSEEALCSICGKDWANASMFGPRPCVHERGKDYKGAVCYLSRNDLSFKEYSFVNSPADARSGVIKGDQTEKPKEETDEWTHEARVFDLNMDKEEVMEMTESENKNVLKDLRKKEASPLYLSLKGAFLSALAVSESDEADKENSAVKEDEVEQEEDVLAVTEELSDDLAAKQDDDTEENEEIDAEEGDEEEADASKSAEDGDDSEEVSAADETTDDDSEGEDKDDTDADTSVEDEEVEEASKTAQGQERNTEKNRPESRGANNKPDNFNKPTEPTSLPSGVTGADKTRESEEDDAESQVDDAEESNEEAPAETELKGESSDEDLEPRVKELEATNEALSKENARLKKALHRTLAERVVDTKIALGIEDRESRDETLKDHVTRSASSLADSLRDLRNMKPITPEKEASPQVENKSAAIGDYKDDDHSPIEGESDDNKELVPEDVFVDALMDRRKL